MFMVWRFHNKGTVGVSLWFWDATWRLSTNLSITVVAWGQGAPLCSLGPRGGAEVAGRRCTILSPRPHQDITWRDFATLHTETRCSSLGGGVSLSVGVSWWLGHSAW